MATIAVTGIAGFLGSRVQDRLQANGHTVVGIDTRVPTESTGLVFREADVRSAPDVRAAMRDVDVVVHLAASDPRDGGPDRTVDVDGTRVVVAAAVAAGVDALVVMSSAMVYGAADDNPVPLDESAPLRGPEDFPPAAHKRAVEAVVAELVGDDGPRTVVLRPAMVVGTDAEILLTRALQGTRLVAVRGHHPPVQFVHVDDLAAAVVLAVEEPLSGPYNVAAEGWLSFDEARDLLGRRSLEVPEELAFAATDRGHALGLSRLPASALPWVMHPWVVSPRRLVEAGWQPTLSNRDLAELLAQQVGDRIDVGSLSADRRTVARAGVAVAATVGGGLLALGLLARRRRDTGPAPADPTPPGDRDGTDDPDGTTPGDRPAPEGDGP